MSKAVGSCSSFLSPTFTLITPSAAYLDLRDIDIDRLRVGTTSAVFEEIRHVCHTAARLPYYGCARSRAACVPLPQRSRWYELFDVFSVRYANWHQAKQVLAICRRPWNTLTSATSILVDVTALHVLHIADVKISAKNCNRCPLTVGEGTDRNMTIDAAVQFRLTFGHFSVRSLVTLIKALVIHWKRRTCESLK